MVLGSRKCVRRILIRFNVRARYKKKQRSNLRSARPTANAWPLAYEQVGKIYACEIIPTHLRARVVAVELLANWLVNFAVALTAPLFLRSSLSGPYFLYGSATLLAVCACVLMPETKGRTLEEIENAFEQKHIVPESSRELTEERQTL